MLRRNASQLELSERALLPPVEFPDLASSTLLEEGSHSKRSVPHSGGIAPCDAGDGRGVEVIVVVVGLYDHVDRWKSIELDGCRYPSFRANELNG